MQPASTRLRDGWGLRQAPQRRAQTVRTPPKPLPRSRLCQLMYARCAAGSLPSVDGQQRLAGHGSFPVITPSMLRITFATSSSISSALNLLAKVDAETVLAPVSWSRLFSSGDGWSAL